MVRERTPHDVADRGVVGALFGFDDEVAHSRTLDRTRSVRDWLVDPATVIRALGRAFDGRPEDQYGHSDIGICDRVARARSGYLFD